MRFGPVKRMIDATTIQVFWVETNRSFYTVNTGANREFDRIPIGHRKASHVLKYLVRSYSALTSIHLYRSEQGFDTDAEPFSVSLGMLDANLIQRTCNAKSIAANSTYLEIYRRYGISGLAYDDLAIEEIEAIADQIDNLTKN